MGHRSILSNLTSPKILSIIVTLIIIVTFIPKTSKKSQQIEDYIVYLRKKSKPYEFAKKIYKKCQNLNPSNRSDSESDYALFNPLFKNRRDFRFNIRVNRWFNLTLDQNQKHVLSCIPPKSGTSNWQTAMMRLIKIDKQMEANDNFNTTFKNYKFNDNFYKLLPRVSKIHFENDYFDFKFMNSRHPLTRLVSAYHSKFEIHGHQKNLKRSSNYFLTDYYPIISSRYEQEKNLTI